MAYCSRTDIEAKLPASELQELTQDVDGDSVDNRNARITDAIAWADAKIDSYAGQKYTVPFTDVPDTVKYASVDLAIYRLFSRRYDVLEVPDNVVQLFKDAIAWLKDVGKGAATISVPAPAENPGRASSTTVTSESRNFNMTKLNTLY